MRSAQGGESEMEERMITRREHNVLKFITAGRKN